MVKVLLAAEAWVSTRVSLPSVSFRPIVGFAKLAAAYERLYEDHSQALWDSTYCLWISKEQARVKPFLGSYYPSVLL